MLYGHRILPDECTDTSKFLLMFDKLFDSFNGHTYSDTNKQYTGCLKSGSPHTSFWKEMLPILKSIQFKTVSKKRDGTLKNKFEKVPSTLNWASNIECFLEMWELLKMEHEICNLLTRNFNQDPLEFFFCSIRSNGVRNTNPTCTQFINAYKTLLVNNLCSPHSVNANCEVDDSKCLQTLTHLLNIKIQCASQNRNIIFNIDNFIEKLSTITCGENPHNIIHKEAKRYVAGFIIKNVKEKYLKIAKFAKIHFFILKSILRHTRIIGITQKDH